MSLYKEFIIDERNMSKGTTAPISSQRKSLLKKYPLRDSSGGDQLSDDEPNRRQAAYTFTDKDKPHRKASNVNELRKTNNQLSILRDILFNARDFDKYMQKSNGHLSTHKPERMISKPSVGRTGKNPLLKKSSNARPTSAKSVSLSGVIDRIYRSDDERLSMNSTDDADDDDDRTRHHRYRCDGHHVSPTATRSSSLFTQARQTSATTRSNNNVSFLSEGSKIGGKCQNVESTVTGSTSQIKKLLDLLWLEFNDLESLTGFQSDRKASTNTCSTALAFALLTLTGHVKENIRSCQGKHEMKNFKDQLSIVIKNQLDFQQKIENQMYTLQTMMQTVCQLVNNEIISNRKSDVKPDRSNQGGKSSEITHSIPSSSTTTRVPPVSSSSRLYRNSTESDLLNEPRDQWTSIKPKAMNNAMDELLTFAQRMNDDTPMEFAPPRRHSVFNETFEAPRKVIRPASAKSSNETHSFDLSKANPSRSSMLSPIETPPSYDLFESGLPTSISSGNVLRQSTGGGSVRPSSAMPPSSMKETLLEKILQERLRLVQHMAELTKQHEITQEELAILETRTTHDQSS